jgi:hypothetical protein
MDVKFGICKLNNANYQTWQFKTKMLLTREDLWKYVDPGTPPTPVTDAWTTGDSKAMATIALLVEDNQVNMISRSATAKEMWTTLQSVHHRATLTSKVSLLKAICSKNYVHGRSMEDHLFEMEELFGKLENAGQALAENLKVAMILRSLPDSFNALTTALEARSDADLTLQLIRPKLIDEAKKEATGGSSEVALKAGNFTCFYCNKPGHIKRYCKKFLAEKGGNQEEEIAQKVFQEEKSTKSYTFMVTAKAFPDKHGWLVDSGSSSHMCCDKDQFVEMKKIKQTIYLADGKELQSKESELSN